jgi:hypothetical protein
MRRILLFGVLIVAVGLVLAVLYTLLTASGVALI